MFLSISITGFSVAFLHAAIPTHWLPFVMASRTQKWSKSKTLGITALAGGGHVLLTTVLGIFIVWLGIELDKKIGHVFPLIAGGALILFGLYYIVQQLRGGHGHHHFTPYGHSHDHGHAHTPARTETRLAPLPTKLKGAPPDLVEYAEATHSNKRYASDRMAILSLLALLTFSPCEGFLPVYLSGISLGWLGFAILSSILAIGTLAGMMLFTTLTLIGMEKLKLAAIEKYEGFIMGSLLCILGLAIIILEH